MDVDSAAGWDKANTTGRNEKSFDNPGPIGVFQSEGVKAMSAVKQSYNLNLGLNSQFWGNILAPFVPTVNEDNISFGGY